jgi:glutamate N-acetyltransferase/amino-acid N-acetyltransferase
MPVNLSEPIESNILPVKGVRLGTAAAGIRYQERDDVALLVFDDKAISSAVFTQNTFCAAPVLVAKEHLGLVSPKALLINSGNANAVTGDKGIADAKQSCQWVADKLGVKTEEVLPFSTGVIGELLPMQAVETGIELAIKNLSQENWLNAAKAIMTTDTLPKVISKQLEIDGKTVTLTGMSKGSGMICPDMATMLAYIVTDVAIEQSVLDQIMQSVTAKSFNAITVDSDTSTNDSFVVTATQQVCNAVIDDLSSKSARAFIDAFESLAIQLAQAIIRDGEGATKFVEVSVSGGESVQNCKLVALSVANSPLVKTALFASDPNWGRLLMAIGKSPVELDEKQIDVSVNGLSIVKKGQPDPAYTEEQGQQKFDKTEISIEINIGSSSQKSTIWTSDLSHEYVTINAEYRS